MKKYKVTYYSVYHIEAEDEDEAIEKADELREKDFIKPYDKRAEFSFGVEAEEIKERNDKS